MGIDERKVWNTYQVAEFLGKSPGAIRNLVLRRSIPFRKRSGRLYFLRREIEEWLERAPGVRLEEIDEAR